jgi:vanillate O-demethylase ferredoxin subunit
MTPATRRILAALHRWTGMTVGIVASYFALTGLGMLFKPQLQPIVEQALQPTATCGRRMPLDDLIALSRGLHPSGVVRQLELTDAGRGVTTVRYADLEGVRVDPCTGALLGEQARWGGVFGTVEKFHRLRFLESSDASELVSGSVSLVMGTVLAIGGLALWWPRNRTQLRHALKLPRGLKGLAFDVKLHRTLGGYAALVLLASAVASWTMTFDWARGVAYVITASKPPAGKPHIIDSGVAWASSEALLSAVLRDVPTADSITLAYPRKPGEPVEVIVIERDAPHPNARTMVYLDPASARIVRHEPYATSPAGYKLYRWLCSLHMGYVGGPIGQLVLLAAMSCVPVLAFTGIRSWVRRRRVAGERVREGAQAPSAGARA